MVTLPACVVMGTELPSCHSGAAMHSEEPVAIATIVATVAKARSPPAAMFGNLKIKHQIKFYNVF